VFKVHRLARETRAFFDGALQRFFGHGHLAGLLHHQPQAGIGGGVCPVASGNHDVFGQFAEQAALGVGRHVFVFGFPLCAHGGCSF
jgi:hypothetical protein